MIEQTAALIDAARQAGVLVIYIQSTTLPGHRSDSVAWLYYKHARARRAQAEGLCWPEHSLDGTWGWQIVDAIAPRSGDLVVKKHRSSAFINTRLDLLLRSNNILTVIITGLVTEGCVQATALDASFHDYIVVLVEDCIGSCRAHLQVAALEVMRAKFDVVTSNQIIRTWAARPAAKGSPSVGR
jgi:ureidoacrylate peracid hydrolase